MIINGKDMNFKSEITISKLLKELNLSTEKVVVEVNLKIIPKENYECHKLYERDNIEVVSFVGGG